MRIILGGEINFKTFYKTVLKFHSAKRKSQNLLTGGNKFMRNIETNIIIGDLGGEIKWLVIGNGTVLVDLRFLEEYRLSVLVNDAY